MLHIPGKFLTGAHPHEQFELDIQGDVVSLRPVGAARPFWQRATLKEREDAFEKWAVTSPPDTPDLPDECLRREGLYD
jgi:hypothetical protein